MTDAEALQLAPALREFVAAVNDRDAELVAICLEHTPPATLAVLAAGWVGDLQNDREVDRRRVELAEARASALSERFMDMRKRRDELRALLNRNAAAAPTAAQKRKGAA